MVLTAPQGISAEQVLRLGLLLLQLRFNRGNLDVLLVEQLEGLHCGEDTRAGMGSEGVPYGRPPESGHGENRRSPQYLAYVDHRQAHLTQDKRKRGAQEGGGKELTDEIAHFGFLRISRLLRPASSMQFHSNW